jgi:hypothetical protein
MNTARTKSITSKVPHEEYALLTSMAREQTVSAWARDVLLAAVHRRPIEELLLAEVLALRMIVINLHYVVATSGAPTPETMQRLVDRADRDNWQQAEERLAATGRR